LEEAGVNIASSSSGNSGERGQGDASAQQQQQHSQRQRQRSILRHSRGSEDEDSRHQSVPIHKSEADRDKNRCEGLKPSAQRLQAEKRMQHCRGRARSCFGGTAAQLPPCSCLNRRAYSACRAAQRAFRARKKEKEKAKEAELQELTERLATTELEARSLQQRNSLLEAALAASRKIAAESSEAALLNGDGSPRQVRCSCTCSRAHARHACAHASSWHALRWNATCAAWRNTGLAQKETAGA
jgi:hypothetical protein